ncbi:MAG: hypothetical protein CMP76_09035 [Flavobacterium sp.]|uniref:hypothetical protein n=1 Tax=unclassified Flavobacterium TaxID=196869 RepID=UPI000C3DE350|nr:MULTISPECIES: hypothetical protein [unclassified Flavobacterium]MBF03425.1 hypothetical protein [Flavobacterium sp.]MCO6161992.1 hypothetical protein [Flavobacterium sp. NRK F7]|tara:strand:+ start:1328 stop:1750 length:423 start_codon:yes stop_codon:yes gene_type:complete
MNLHKITKFAAIILAVVSVLFLGLLMASSEDGADNKWITPLIYLSYIVLAICIGIVLIYVLKNLFSDSENLKKTLISVALFAGVLVVSYLLANGDDVRANGEVYSGSTPKLVGAGLNAFYILTVVALGTMVWAGFTKIKK